MDSMCIDRRNDKYISTVNIYTICQNNLPYGTYLLFAVCYLYFFKLDRIQPTKKFPHPPTFYFDGFLLFENYYYYFFIMFF